MPFPLPAPYLAFLSTQSNSSERSPGRFWYQHFSLQQNLSSFGKYLHVWTSRLYQEEPKHLAKPGRERSAPPSCREAKQSGSGFSVGLGYPCFKIPVWLGATHSISLVPELPTVSCRHWSASVPGWGGSVLEAGHHSHKSYRGPVSAKETQIQQTLGGEKERT